MSKKTVDSQERVPAKLRERYDSIVALTDAVCREHLTEEYAALCRRMAATLCRKRPSPLESAKAESWAAAITHAAGSVNFLFDKSQDPHLSAKELCAAFGTSQSNTSAKASQIWKLLGLMPFHPEWSLGSKAEQNPLIWMLSVNGVLMDVRHAPRAVQEIAYEQGLIPFLPTSAGGEAPVGPRLVSSGPAPPETDERTRVLLGKWRITDMEMWDREAFELLGPAYFEFTADGRGDFRFIAVTGDMDCEYFMEDGSPIVEFSWDGADECDPASGYGWATLEEDGALVGQIAFHAGDESGFAAVRFAEEKMSARRDPQARRRPR